MFNQFDDVRFMAHINLHAPAAYGVGHGFCACTIEVGDHHLFCAIAGKAFGHRLADAAGTTRYHDDFVSNFHESPGKIYEARSIRPQPGLIL